MNTKLQVGNLAPTTTETDLQNLFSAHGNVDEINFTLDPHSRRPSGSAFVTMSTPQGALAAIHALHGKELRARPLSVHEAPSRSSR